MNRPNDSLATAILPFAAYRHTFLLGQFRNTIGVIVPGYWDGIIDKPILRPGPASRKVTGFHPLRQGKNSAVIASRNSARNLLVIWSLTADGAGRAPFHVSFEVGKGGNPVFHIK
jgi:hypothetical protein